MTSVKDFIRNDPRHHVRPETVVRVPHTMPALGALFRAQERGVAYLVVQQDDDDFIVDLDTEEWVKRVRAIKIDSAKTIGELTRGLSMRLPVVSPDSNADTVAWATWRKRAGAGLAVFKIDGEFDGLVTSHESESDSLKQAVTVYQCPKGCIYYPPIVPAKCRRHTSPVTHASRR
jgi:hypothetical protein